MISGKLLLGVIAILLAYLYSRLNDQPKSPEDLLEEAIISAWHSSIQPPAKRFSRVAVGTNACVDVIVKGTALLKALNVAPGDAKDHDFLHSLDDLQEVFAYHLSRGAGAERAFLNGEAFDKVVNAAKKLNKVEWHTGGNAALIGQKIVSTFPDVKVQLVGPIGPKQKSLLHPSILVPASSLTEKDEVHLIMEYSVGEEWGAYKTPTATRFITSHDVHNTVASPLENFFDTLGSFQPELVVLSGLHMLEGQGEGVWEDRLGVLRDRLSRLPRALPVHLEMASMANPAFVKVIIDKIFPLVTAIGLNEQEIAMTSEAGSGPHSDLLLEGGQPSISKVGDMIDWILTKYGYNPQSNPSSRLTRVHFHCLSFHVLGTVEGTWRNTDAAVAAGTRMAGRQACDINILDTGKIELRIPRMFKLHSQSEEQKFDPQKPVISWGIEGRQFNLSPVLVCQHPLKTVGLGDAISATGLLYSQFNPHYAESVK